MTAVLDFFVNTDGLQNAIPIILVLTEYLLIVFDNSKYHNLKII